MGVLVRKEASAAVRGRLQGSVRLRHARVAKNCRDLFFSLGRSSHFPFYRPAVDCNYFRGHRGIERGKTPVSPRISGFACYFPNCPQRADEEALESVRQHFYPRGQSRGRLSIQVIRTFTRGTLAYRCVRPGRSPVPGAFSRGPINRIVRMLVPES